MLGDSVHGIYPANVTIFKYVNQYHYNASKLIWTYAIAFGSASVAVIAGLAAYVANGRKSCNNNFSTLLCATRNPDLDKITMRETQGLFNAPTDEFLKTCLQYGTLQSINEKSGQDSRVGFGLPEQVLDRKRGYRKVNGGQCD